MLRRLTLAVACLIVSANAAYAQSQLRVNNVAPPDTVTVAAGSTVTVSLTDGPGHPTDWVGLYLVGAGDGAYLNWSYLNGSTGAPATGLTNATMSFLAPVTPGTYEFRLFANNSYQLLAASAVVAVTTSSAQLAVNGVSPPTSVTVGAGSPVTVGVTDGPGNTTDWVALSAASSADGAYIDWRYLNGSTVAPTTGLANATVTFQAPVTPGDYEFRFYANNGYARLATSATTTVVAPSAELTVNGVSAPTAVPVGPGTQALVHVTNGPANAGDWIGLYTVGSADTGYLQLRYLNGTTSLPASGTSSATLMFGMPTNAGSYEFRLFTNNSFARLTTSTTVIVAASTAQLAVNGTVPPDPATVAAGSVAIVSVSDGPGNATDWVALSVAGSADTAYIDWRYLSDTAVAPASGLTATTLHVTMPTTAGNYEFRFFANNGYGRLATSPPITIPTPPAQMTVNSTLPPTPVSVQPGASVTLQLIGGPGNATDWIALAQTSAPNTSYVSWQYLNGAMTPPVDGVTSATLNVTLPTTAGSYEFRLFANNGFGRLATSTSVTATSTPPAVSITLTSPFPGTTFTGPVSIDVAANATVTNGTIAQVDFFANTTPIGTATSSPYEIAWSAAAGTYALTAVATDNVGGTTTSLPVSIGVTEGGAGFGTLGMPIATPPDGVYGPGQLVTLAAAAGATIRYTTTGLAPTATSPIYTGPIAMAPYPWVLEARAFESGWTASPVLVGNYIIDDTPPFMTPNYYPPPNTAGWNNTAVRVTFTCQDDGAGVATCPPPVMFTNEGAGQTFTVTATDSVGNQTTATMTVNIDETPGTVTLGAPADGATVSSPSVTVTGTINDALSGIAQATCNGVPASVSGDAVTCAVTLHNGLNAVVIYATDQAGNSASAGAHVTLLGTPSSIAVVPSRHTLAIGETVLLSAVDDFGQPVNAATWTSEDATVATVALDGTVVAVAAGQTTVTASTGTLSAQATIAVFAGSTLPVGTTRWSIDPTPGYYTQDMVGVGPVGSDGTSLALVETALDGSNMLIRGLNIAGEQTYVAAVPLAPGEYVNRVMGDVGGGVLVATTSYAFYSLVRVSTSTSAAVWRYTAPRGLSSLAQGPDGTIFGIGYDGFGSTIVGIDGLTGSQKFQISLPHGSSGNYNNCDNGHSSFSEAGSTAGSIVVGADGAAYVEVLTEDRAEGYAGPFFSCTGFFRTVDSKLSIYRILPTGSVSVGVLQEDTDATNGFPSTGLGDVFPDEQGGVVATWRHSYSDGLGGSIYSQRGRYVNGVAPLQEYELPAWPSITASGRIAYGNSIDFTSVVKFNMTNGGVLCTIPNHGPPTAALDSGRVAVASDDGGTTIYGPDCSVVATGLVYLQPTTIVDDMWIGLVGYSLPTNVVATPAALDVQAGFPLPYVGSSLKNSAPLPSYSDPQSAAFSALNFAWPGSWDSNWEFGGLICQSGPNKFYVTGPVTAHDNGEIDVFAFIRARCNQNSTTVGNFHTHAGLFGQPFPSGAEVAAIPSDVNNANLHPDFVFYLMTKPLRSTDSNAVCPVVGCVATIATFPSRSFYRFQGPNSINNMWLKLPLSMGDPYMNGGWVVFPRQ